MNHFSFELSLVAVLPALLLCGYVFYKDRIEKEPLGLLALLFGLGAVAYIPTSLLQNLVIRGIDGLFADAMRFSPEGAVTFQSAGAETAHLLLCAFLGFSVVQIAVKWCLLYFVTRKNKHFNYLFDGIVYAAFLSLGFAVAENIHFLLQNDLELLMAKLLTSVPCHLFVGILMGYYYTMWHVRFVANGIENDMKRTGLVKEDRVRTSAPWLIASLLVPYLVNAVYVFAGSVHNEIVVFIFYAAVFMLYGVSFIAIDRIAARDCNSKRYLCRILAKGHPELTADVLEQVVDQGADSVREEDAE